MKDLYIKENYNLIRKLGEGAFGSVFLVTKKNDFRKIALKKIIIKSDKKESLKTKLEKAENEIDILKSFANPECNPNLSCYINHNIIENKNIFIVYLEMEFIEGKTIDQYIIPFQEEGDTDNLINIVYITVKGICLALKEIHNKNILHQNIKPENIMVDNNTMIPILVDFGLSCLTNPRGAEYCISDKCCKSGGTYSFMAPERIFSDSKVGYPKSDVWSLGSTIYYIIFKEHIRDPRKIQTVEINKCNTGIPLLDTLINGMTEIEIDERYSVDLVLEILKDI